MSYRRCVSVGLLALLTAGALGAGGCGSNGDRREASSRATAEAEARAQQVTITSATFELPTEAKEAGDEALSALRREQTEYRAKLEAELDVIDARLRAARADGVPATHPASDAAAASVRRRDALKQHLDALGRSTAQDWAVLKAKIDRDLRKSGAAHDRQGHDRQGGR